MSACETPGDDPPAAAADAAPSYVAPSYPDSLLERARALTQRFILVDGHIDVPYRMTEFEEDITGPTDFGDFDYERAKAGGLDAPFMSIYIPARYQDTPDTGYAFADSLIDMVEGFATRAPDRYAIATSVDDVRRNHEQGIISLPLGMENGAPIGDDLANLRHFYDRGIRYVTLTHGRDNQLSDSSYDTTRTHQGLSDFGLEVVDEMNRLGLIVDISHLSDSAAFQVLRRSQAPVFASHSSARRFTPDWERNMSDDLIRALAERDGVIMINFGSSFLNTRFQDESRPARQRIDDEIEARGLVEGTPEHAAFMHEQRRSNPFGSVTDVADHIDHVVELAGVDHVGIGSDYDGVTFLPAGLQDASTYPNLVAELLQRGYSEEDLQKILGENALRVWSAVEAAARRLGS